jgi:glycerol-3-phosphate acyltransferase PlsX
MKKMFKKNIFTKLAALMVSGGLKEFKKMMNPDEVGGTPLLGITKPVVKAHGSSNGYAFKNAIRQARDFAAAGIIKDITANVDVMKLDKLSANED